MSGCKCPFLAFLLTRAPFNRPGSRSADTNYFKAFLLRNPSGKLEAQLPKLHLAGLSQGDADGNKALLL